MSRQSICDQIVTDLEGKGVETVVGLSVELENSGALDGQGSVLGVLGEHEVLEKAIETLLDIDETLITTLYACLGLQLPEGFGEDEETTTWDFPEESAVDLPGGGSGFLDEPWEPDIR